MTPASITTDATNVYFTDTGDGSVNVVPKAGGAVVQLATGQAKPLSIAVDDTYAYWSNNLGGAVVRTLKAGGDTVHTVATATSPTTVVIDGSYVYFLNPSGTLMQAPKTGGTATTFASPPVTTPAFYGIYPGGSGQLYATSSTGAIGEWVWQVSLPAGTMTQSALGEVHSVQDVAAGGTVVAAAELSGGPMIAWADTAGGAHGTIYVTPFVPNPIAVAPCGIVWTLQGLQLSTLGSSVPVMLYAAAAPSALVADGNTVFWTDTSGAVGELPLP
jgi:hypothetical protein